MPKANQEMVFSSIFLFKIDRTGLKFRQTALLFGFLSLIKIERSGSLGLLLLLFARLLPAIRGKSLSLKLFFKLLDRYVLRNGGAYAVVSSIVVRRQDSISADNKIR